MVDEVVAWRGPDDILPARLPVADLARSAVAACATAAVGLAAARGAPPAGPVVIDSAAVATAFTSERHLRVDGVAPSPFAPLSRFWPAADGWVRTHANYPHHRDRLLAALGTGPDGLAAAIAARPAAETEQTVYAAGGLAVAVCAAPPAAARPAADPLKDPLTSTRVAAAGRPLGAAPPGRPAAGIRVLDLTRVIAGPVATRTLALLGADVLRIDPPGLPEIPEQHADTGFGKRSTLLDLRADADREVFDELLDTADVLITGYRPGALDRLGLHPDALRARQPDLVIARLRAWDDGRRGFDSLVQAATGIALIEGDDGRPGVLPAQALDHATGYLVAAAVLDALAARPAGTATTIDASLVATARRLLALPRTAPAPARAIAPTTATAGRLTYALPAFTLPGGPSTWDAPPTVWGSDPPQWRKR